MSPQERVTLSTTGPCPACGSRRFRTISGETNHTMKVLTGCRDCGAVVTGVWVCGRLAPVMTTMGEVKNECADWELPSE